MVYALFLWNTRCPLLPLFSDSPTGVIPKGLTPFPLLNQGYRLFLFLCIASCIAANFLCDSKSWNCDTS
jgi:hypothetical protein